MLGKIFAVLVALFGLAVVPARAQALNAIRAVTLPVVLKHQIDPMQHRRDLRWTIGALLILDQEKGARFSPIQARRLETIFREWRFRPTMSEGQALVLNKSIKSVLAAPQNLMVGDYVRERRSRRGGFGGMYFMLAQPPEFNPLNPETIPFERSREAMTLQIPMLLATFRSVQ